MKTAVIAGDTISGWVSCKEITTGLLISYRILGKKRGHQIKTVSPESKVSFQDILKWKPDRIVFLDTWSHYGNLFAAIQKEKKNTSWKPSLRFHVYGDFTLRARWWKNWSTLLEGMPTQWVCASLAQAKLVSSFLLPEGDTQKSVSVCPFPLLPHVFGFNEKERAKARLIYRLGKRDRLWTYAGRLTLQKNILAIIDSWEIKAAQDPHLRLAFAGDFDDLAAPCFGIYFAPNSYFSLIQKRLDLLSPKLRKRVLFTGFLHHNKLTRFLLASDLFLSPSLHHDEDFGLSPCQAIASGTPTLLTGWGGYHDFKISEKAVQAIPVQLDKGGPRFELSELIHRADQMTITPFDSKSRLELSKKANDLFGVARVIRELDRLETSTPAAFLGFSEKHANLLSQFPENREHPEFHEFGTESFYNEVYNDYV